MKSTWKKAITRNFPKNLSMIDLHINSKCVLYVLKSNQNISTRLRGNKVELRYLVEQAEKDQTRVHSNVKE